MTGDTTVVRYGWLAAFIFFAIAGSRPGLARADAGGLSADSVSAGTINAAVVSAGTINAAVIAGTTNTADALRAQCRDLLDNPFHDAGLLTGDHKWKAGHDAGGIDYILAGVPDPLDSGLGSSFDSTIEALELAIQKVGYLRDRSWLPWNDRRLEADLVLSQRCREFVPGVVLFRLNARDVGDADLHAPWLAVLLVGEVSTAGVHREALAEAVRHLPASSCAPIRYLGPVFSGSAASIRDVLSGSPEAAEGATAGPMLACADRTAIKGVSFLSGSVSSGSVQSMFTQNTGWHFQSTRPPNQAVERSFYKYLIHNRQVTVEAGILEGVALLVESGTAYGQSVSRRPTGDGSPDPAQQGESYTPQLSLEFPPLRHAVQTPTGAQSDDAKSAGHSFPRRDIEPALARSTDEGHDILLDTFFEQIIHNGIRIVGIVASDPQDVLDLAHRIHGANADVRVFAFDTDVTYLDQTQARDMYGALVVSSYLFPGDGEYVPAGRPLGRGHDHVPIDGQLYAGVFNAALAVVRPSKFADDAVGYVRTDGGTFLPIWIAAVGNDQFAPLAIASEVEGGGAEGGTQPFVYGEDRGTRMPAGLSDIHAPETKAWYVLAFVASLGTAYILFVFVRAGGIDGTPADEKRCTNWLLPLESLFRRCKAPEHNLDQDQLAFLLVGYLTLFMGGLAAVAWRSPLIDARGTVVAIVGIIAIVAIVGTVIWRHVRPVGDQRTEKAPRVEAWTPANMRMVRAFCGVGLVALSIAPVWTWRLGMNPGPVLLAVGLTVAALAALGTAIGLAWRVFAALSLGDEYKVPWHAPFLFVLALCGLYFMAASGSECPWSAKYKQCLANLPATAVLALLVAYVAWLLWGSGKEGADWLKARGYHLAVFALQWAFLLCTGADFAVATVTAGAYEASMRPLVYQRWTDLAGGLSPVMPSLFGWGLVTVYCLGQLASLRTLDALEHLPQDARARMHTPKGAHVTEPPGGGPLTFVFDKDPFAASIQRIEVKVLALARWFRRPPEVLLASVLGAGVLLLMLVEIRVEPLATLEGRGGDLLFQLTFLVGVALIGFALLVFLNFSRWLLALLRALRTHPLAPAYCHVPDPWDKPLDGRLFGTPLEFAEVRMLLPVLENVVSLIGAKRDARQPQNSSHGNPSPAPAASLFVVVPPETAEQIRALFAGASDKDLQSPGEVLTPIVAAAQILYRHRRQDWRGSNAGASVLGAPDPGARRAEGGQSIDDVLPESRRARPSRPPGNTPEGKLSRRFDQNVDILIASVVSVVISQLIAQYRYLVLVVVGCTMFLLLKLTSYPFAPHGFLTEFLWIGTLVVVASTFVVYAVLRRDPLLALIGQYKPGNLSYNLDLVKWFLTWVAVPTLSAAAIRYPAVFTSLASLVGLTAKH